MRFPTYLLAGAAAVSLTACTSMPPEPPTDAPAAPTSTAASPAPAQAAAPAPQMASLSRVEPPFDELTTLDVVLDRIRKKEGLRLDAYQGPSGKWLIGYGHSRGVQPGMSITRARAEELLREDVGNVERVIKSAVRVPINAAELSAMVDLTYNIGTGNFRDSTVLRKLNEGDRQGAADGFLLWTKVTQNGKKVSSPQLVQRRSEDRRLFLGEVHADS